MERRGRGCSAGPLGTSEGVSVSSDVVCGLIDVCFPLYCLLINYKSDWGVCTSMILLVLCMCVACGKLCRCTWRRVEGEDSLSRCLLSEWLTVRIFFSVCMMLMYVYSRCHCQETM